MTTQTTKLSWHDPIFALGIGYILGLITMGLMAIVYVWIVLHVK